jgi:hypothetical protein
MLHHHPDDILSLSKKRPVLIRHWGLVAFGVVLVAALYPLLESRSFVVVVPIVIFPLFFRLWFVYGLTEPMISEALGKAASATRAPIEKLNGGYKIDNSLNVRLHNPVGRIHVISFKKGGESKKAKLTAVVFKKFMQNYFV